MDDRIVSRLDGKRGRQVEEGGGKMKSCVKNRVDGKHADAL